jgi:myosin-5
MSSMLEQLNHVYSVLQAQGLDWPIVEQIFRQIFRWIAVQPINNVLVRKDCCNWSKGMEIKFNVISVEEWAREHNMGPKVAGQLQTLRELSNLLILNKAKNADDAVQSICDAVPSLKTSQVVKILNMYAGQVAEERIPASLVERVEAQLQLLRNEPETSSGDSPLCTPESSAGPEVPFVPSQVALESLEIPENMNLRFLKKL